MYFGKTIVLKGEFDVIKLTPTGDVIVLLVHE